MKCPCVDCVVFAMCNGQIQDEGVTRLVIIGLALTCPILRSFLTDSSTVSLSFDNKNINSAKRVFGGRLTNDL